MISQRAAAAGVSAPWLKNNGCKEMAVINALEDAFVHELSDMYNAEKQIVKTLPKVIKMTSDAKLREALEKHAEETESQMRRIEQTFDALGRKAQSVKCEGMKGILDEGEVALDKKLPAETRDAMIVASCQKVAHYEIATYGTLCAWADQLGFGQPASLLKQNLAEERNADQLLTDCAMRINSEAERLPASQQGM
jgi:ferritin-like metal-binding protein YciE